MKDRSHFGFWLCSVKIQLIPYLPKIMSAKLLMVAIIGWIVAIILAILLMWKIVQKKIEGVAKATQISALPTEASEIEKMTIEAIREELREGCGVRISGTKMELVQRLRAKRLEAWSSSSSSCSSCSSSFSSASSSPSSSSSSCRRP